MRGRSPVSAMRTGSPGKDGRIFVRNLLCIFAILFTVSACAAIPQTSVPGPDGITARNVKERLDLVSVGLSQDDVRDMIGNPDRVSRTESIDAQGNAVEVDICAYTINNLSSHSLSLAFAAAFSGASPNAVLIRIIYRNGNAVSVQRFY